MTSARGKGVLRKNLVFQVVLWHDANKRAIWRSENHGKSWEPVTDIPEDQAVHLFEHPYDNDKVCRDVVSEETGSRVLKTSAWV